MQILLLSRQLRDRLDAFAEGGYPNEVCGLLVGRETARETVVERVEQAANLATERLEDRYRLDPDDYLATDTAARRAGLEIVGVWHTHPDHPARPSATDLEAAWAGFTYLIVSVTRGVVAGRRAWRLHGSQFVEQRIEENGS